MRKSSLFTGILVAALSVSLLVFAGCDNPASGDSSGNTEQTGNNNQTGQNGGNNQNTNNGTVPNVTENVPESAEKVTTASQKEDFIYEVVNKSNKKVSVAVFISDNQKYGENPNNRDAAIVAITDAVELAAGESHEFKFSINDVTAKYGTGTCFGFAFVPEGGSRSRGWMNGTVYGKGRKHTVTINEYFNARNSWSYLPGNPAINVHGYWEGIYQGKDAFIRLRADGDMSLIVYNKDNTGKITGWSESDGTWTCDSEKIFASYYDVDKKAKVNAEIPYQTAADSIKFTIDGAQSTWTASTTFEVDEWKDSQDEKWSELASKDENGKYIYYCYGYNKLPKEYWDYEDSDVFYRTGETSIANMYYESCASKIEEALNKKEFDVSDFDGGCLILKSNPQTGSGSNQNTNQSSGQNTNQGTQQTENPVFQEHGYIELDMSKFADKLQNESYVHIERQKKGSENWDRVILYEGWSNGNKLESNVVIKDYYVDVGSEYTYRLRAWNWEGEDYANNKPITIGTFTADKGLGEIKCIHGKATYNETEKALEFSQEPSYEPAILVEKQPFYQILYIVEKSTNSEYVYFYMNNIQNKKIALINAADASKYKGKKIVPYEEKCQVSQSLGNKCNVYWVMETKIPESDTSYPSFIIPDEL